MKNIVKVLPVIAVIFALSIAASCSKDKGKDPVPTPPAPIDTTSVDTTSKTCPPGYEGADCKTETRLKYVGTYHATDQTTSGVTINYIATIELVPGDVTLVKISNLSNSFFTNTVTASCADTVSLKIFSQQPDNDDYGVQGECKLGATPNNLNVNYILKEQSSGSVINFTGTWVKQ